MDCMDSGIALISASRDLLCNRPVKGALIAFRAFVPVLFIFSVSDAEAGGMIDVRRLVTAGHVENEFGDP